MEAPPLSWPPSPQTNYNKRQGGACLPSTAPAGGKRHRPAPSWRIKDYHYPAQGHFRSRKLVGDGGGGGGGGGDGGGSSSRMLGKDALLHLVAL